MLINAQLVIMVVWLNQMGGNVLNKRPFYDYAKASA